MKRHLTVYTSYWGALDRRFVVVAAGILHAAVVASINATLGVAVSVSVFVGLVGAAVCFPANKGCCCCKGSSPSLLLRLLQQLSQQLQQHLPLMRCR